jgi:hypothetical protein
VVDSRIAECRWGFHLSPCKGEVASLTRIRDKLRATEVGQGWVYLPWPLLFSGGEFRISAQDVPTYRLLAPSSDPVPICHSERSEKSTEAEISPWRNLRFAPIFTSCNLRFLLPLVVGMTEG